MSVEDLPVPSSYERFHPFLKGVFSQWHETPFVVDGERYTCAEQWMMAAKARLFGDLPCAAAIMAAAMPSEHKRLGQQVRGFKSSRWDEFKIDIVARGNLEKFRQNPGARRQLVNTGDAMLVEANSRDWNWGCGLAADHPSINNPSDWPGHNLLGRILTLLRDRLPAESA